MKAEVVAGNVSLLQTQIRNRLTRKRLEAIFMAMVGCWCVKQACQIRFSIATNTVHDYDHFNIAKTVHDGRLPVYWINLDKSTEKRSRMENMFAQHMQGSAANIGINPIRMAAMDTEKALQLYKIKAFALTEQRRRKIELIYGGKAVCLTLSHLTTILQAYDEGQETILVLEDDIVLSKEFLLNWESYAKLAPSDWNALQWSTSNDVVVQQGLNLTDPWISWQPDHFSARAYMLRREGMRQILQHTQKRLKDGTFEWIVFDEKGLDKADEMIFYLAQPSYTTTYPWITVSDARMNSTMSTILHATPDLPPLPPIQVSRRSERLLILTNLRMATADSVAAEMQRLLVDVEAISMWHSNCTWVANIVLTERVLKPLFDSMASTLPSVDFRIQIRNGNFNKFKFMLPLLGEMPSYDYILMKDSDIRLAGFPWNTFMEKKGDALVVGPLCQSPDESLHGNRYEPKRQNFQLHNGLWWKRDENLVPLFTEITPIKVPFLEQFLVLVDGRFAQWYFSQILATRFAKMPADFGVDLMWCGAAYEFNPSQTPCNIVPLISVHADSRTRSTGDVGLFSAAHYEKAASAIFNRNSTLRRWMSKTKHWNNLMGGWADTEEIAVRCQKFTNSMEFSLAQCAEYAWKWA
jgi:GR25 family glycosyltransferase involved in LPS biosynthesis